MAELGFKPSNTRRDNRVRIKSNIKEMTEEPEILKPRAHMDLMPPGKRLSVSFYANGDGRKIELTPKDPQGVNPKILLLEMTYSPNKKKESNPQLVTYHDNNAKIEYDMVEIYSDMKMVDEITVIKTR